MNENSIGFSFLDLNKAKTYIKDSLTIIHIIKLICIILVSITIGYFSANAYFNFQVSEYKTSDNIKITNRMISHSENVRVENNKYILVDNSIVTIKFPKKIKAYQLKYDYKSAKTNYSCLNIYSDIKSNNFESVANVYRPYINCLYTNIKTSTNAITFYTGDVNGKIYISNFKIVNDIEFNYYFMIFICLTSFLMLYLFFFCKDNLKHPTKSLFVIIVLLGTLFISVRSTFLDGWDEHIHFRRSYVAASKLTGQIRTKAFDDLTIDYYASQQNCFKIDNVNNKQILNSIINKDSYIKSSKNYQNNPYILIYLLPSIISNIFSQILGLNLVTSIMLARFFGLLFYAFGVCMVVHVLPFGKSIFGFISLLPTMMYSAVSVTYDIWVFVFLSLAIALLFRIIYDDSCKFTYFYRILFFVLLTLTLIAKIAYFPIIFLILLIPKDKYYSSKDKKVFILSIIAVSVLVIVSFITINVLFGLKNDYRGGDNIDAKKQFIDNILVNPYAYFRLLLSEIKQSFVKYFFLLIDNLYTNEYQFALYKQVRMPLINFSFIIVSAILSRTDIKDNYRNIAIKQRIFNIFVYFMTLCVIWTGFYMVFNDVGSHNIKGVQARYFIPLLLLFVFSFIPNIKYKNKYYNLAIYIMYIIVCLKLIFDLYNSFLILII